MGIAPELWVKAETVRRESVGVCLLPEPANDRSSYQRLWVEGIVVTVSRSPENYRLYSYRRATIGSTRIARRAGM